MNANTLADMLRDGRAVLRSITPKSVLVAFPQTIGEGIAASVRAIQAVCTEEQAECKIAAAIDRAVADEREAIARDIETEQWSWREAVTRIRARK